MRLLPVLLFAAVPVFAQEPIGRTAATEVKVSGAVDIANGETVLLNGSAITAGKQSVPITLTRGGALTLCSTSTVHLSKDRSVPDPASSALMMALDRGALEAKYTVGTYSDVLMTPDLRILISGPGQTDLRIRVNAQGDTCVDNHGANAPYVTVSSELEGGAYRVMPDQRVSFQHGSLQEVVDHEPESCGCPLLPPNAVAENTFPVAQSEGLAAAPPPATAPVVPAGQPHAQVTVPLVYNGENPAPPPPDPAPQPTPAAPVVVTPPPTPPAPEPPSNQQPAKRGFFHSVGRFFSHIFG
jgi:hypothetical protein